MQTLMRGWILAAVAAGWAAAATAKTDYSLERTAPVPAGEPIPALDFFRPVVFHDPRINDAGTRFAALVTGNVDRQELLVYDLERSTFDTLGGVGQKDIYNFNWLDDEKILFSVAKEKRYAEGLYMTDAKSLNEHYYLDLHNVAFMVARPDADRLSPIVWIKHSAYHNGKDGGLIQINTKVRPKNPFADSAYFDPTSLSYGTIASVTRSYPIVKPGIATWYSTDLAGELAYAHSIENGVEHISRLVDGKWVRCPVDLDAVEVLGAGDKPGELLALGPRQEGKPRAIVRMDAATGALGEVLVQDAKYDPQSVRFYRHPVSKALLGIRYDRARRETIWFDRGYESIQTAIEKFLPGQVVQILGSDRAERRFFVSAQSDRQPETYYSVDLEKRTLGLIKCEAPWIDPQRMCATSVVNYKARDGVALEGYLTLPTGTSKAAPAPLVVLAHGGPFARDLWGFNPEVQFLASRGYAVFQPNYRGSTGFQWRTPADEKFAYRKMHDDVTDGVQKLIKSGLIVPDRIAIMGWSFGGYLALSGAAHEGTLYRCAVALSGVYDWEQVMKESKNEEAIRGRFGYLMRHLGDPKTNKAKYDEISPLRHVANVKIPMFVGHGDADVIANINQSKRLVSELKKVGVPVVTRYESGEGHGMAKMKNRIEMYEAIEEFLAANMAPRATPVAAPAP